METKDIILELRTRQGLSQDELAEKVMATRQAVSRWETGRTVPNTETLKLLSKVLDVSINALLGEPRPLICQCCGMPLEDDEIISRNSDGTKNEDYCKWCYADGTYTYSNMDELIDVCVTHMVKEDFTEAQARAYMQELLPTLDYWKKYESLSDGGQFEEFKKQLIKEINDLHVEGLPKVEKLNALVGKYVNLEYPLPNGQSVKLLDDRMTYLGISWIRSLAETDALEYLPAWISSWCPLSKQRERIRSWFFIKKDKQKSVNQGNIPERSRSLYYTSFVVHWEQSITRVARPS